MSWFTFDAPNALVTQCTAAREMAWGRDNLDGWGFAWLDDGRPRGYRTGRSLTDDDAGRQMLRAVTSDRFIVHVRQKTPGSETSERNSAPFSDRGRFFTHNGYVAGFREGAREQLLAKVSPERAAGIQGDTDSEVLFALVLDRLDQGASAPDAVRVVAEVGEVCGGRYNVLLWSDSEIVATRWDNSLYARQASGGVVSSEPLDGGRWDEVPERAMVILSDHGIRLEDW
jgi:gamma-glutamyl hercynylcysteine S-oxide hydrolase